MMECGKKTHKHKPLLWACLMFELNTAKSMGVIFYSLFIPDYFGRPYIILAPTGIIIKSGGSCMDFPELRKGDMDSF